jgi:hypothetical protein
MGKFKLVNPVIIGTFVDTYETSSSDEAAKKFWDSLTSDNKYISGNVPKFLFTLMNTSNNELHHYMVKEKPEGSHADYSISKVDVTMTSKQKKEFLNEINKVRTDSSKMLEQSGGKRRRYEDDDDDDDSSDSDVDDLFRYVRLRNAFKPISYWWYTPALYNIDTVFTPNFVAPISPYVQLWIPMR